MKSGGNDLELLVKTLSLGRLSTTEPALPFNSILTMEFAPVIGAAHNHVCSPQSWPLGISAPSGGFLFGAQWNSLAYLNFSAKQFALCLNVPHSWVLDNANTEYCDDPIPCLPLAKFKRFRWDSPELVEWIERHVVCPYPREAGQLPTADYGYLDSAQFAGRLNISESWVRDGVRSRAEEPIPHVRFGKYVRFRFGSPELEIWAERRMLTGNNRAVSRAQRKETIQ
jgi:hypothetical protein